MREKGMTAIEILRFIPDETLMELAKETKVDYCVKKLTGRVLFYLLLFSFLKLENLSQRSISEQFANPNFKMLFNLPEQTGTLSHSSISARLDNIDVTFFAKVYELIYEKLSAIYTKEELKKKNIIRIDSTMVAETCNKLSEGMTVGRKSAEGEDARKQVKYTIGFDGFGAVLGKVLFDSACLSEDVAMPKVLASLIEKDNTHKNIYVTDRGMGSVENFSDLSKKGATFVGRIKTNRKMESVRSLMTDDTNRDLGSLELVGDDVVRLYDSKEKRFSEQTFRVVKTKFKVKRDTGRKQTKGKSRRVENEVFFITNDMGMSAKEVASVYKKRWDIEVFFRFLKQNLSFSHFISTSENGIKVILYMTFIAAMIIMLYKRENEIDCNAKSAFLCDLEKWLHQLVIVLYENKKRAINIMRNGGVP